MDYREITPEDRLKPFVKCFYIFQSEVDTTFEDIVFPSGFTEIIFNLGAGSWASESAGNYKTTPPIEFWGQVTKPMKIRSTGAHLMLGVRFFPHSAGYFLKEDIGQFSDIVWDLSTVLGNSVTVLHEKLIATNDLIGRIRLIECYLLNSLSTDKKANAKIEKIGSLLHSINRNYTENNVSMVASQHGVSPRYLHKLVYQYTGLSPKSLTRINRFQLSLKLISQKEESLTSIAYECGYFDQSHFIRDFKSFTGVTPSDYQVTKFPVNEIYLQ